MFTPAAVNHMNNPKASANNEGAAKQVFDFFGGGICGHIKIFRPQPEQQIAHRAAHDIGHKASVLQRSHHVHGPLVDQSHVNAMDFHRNFDPFTEVGFARRCGGTTAFSQQFVNQFFYHISLWGPCQRTQPGQILALI